MCFDWDKETVLKPHLKGNLNISLIPCDFLSDFGLEPEDECIADKE